MASASDLQDFIDRQRILLEKERGAEIERSSLLLSNCGPKILEQKGLSLGGLGVVGMHVGLGGKTYAFYSLNSHAIVEDDIQRAAW
jgi:DNA polymerase alpha-associated DNA helicase A